MVLSPQNPSNPDLATSQPFDFATLLAQSFSHVQQYRDDFDVRTWLLERADRLLLSQVARNVRGIKDEASFLHILSHKLITKDCLQRVHGQGVDKSLNLQHDFDSGSSRLRAGGLLCGNSDFKLVL